MINETCRIPLTAILLGIICMHIVKGVSENQDLGIDRHIYQSSNEDSIYDDSYDDNILNYDNEKYAKRIDTRDCDEKENPRAENDEKLKDQIAIKNDNLIVQNQENQIPEDGIENEFIQNQLERQEEFASNSQSNSEVVKRRRDYLSHFKPGRKYPRSYLNINQDAGNQKLPEMFVLSSDFVNEDEIRKFVGPKNHYFLPVCDINENQLVKKDDQILKTPYRTQQKRNMNLYQQPKLKACSDNEDMRKVRALWKLKSHYNGIDTNEIQHNYYKYKNKSPLEYLHINDENRKFVHNEVKDADNENSYALNNRINHFHDYMNSELAEEKIPEYVNNSISRNPVVNQTSNQFLNSVAEKKAQINTEVNITSLKNNIPGFQALSNNTEKIHAKLINKVTENIILYTPDNKSATSNLSVIKETNSTNQISSLSGHNETNSAVLGKIIKNPVISHQTTNLKLTNQLKKELIPVTKENNIVPEAIINSSANKENVALKTRLQSFDVKHIAKNKIQISTTQAAPSPSQPIINLNAITPNISYIYFQPIPINNSAYLQRYGSLTQSPSSEIKLINSNETKNNDIITISIDPKTLQNKILHAEFFKKNEVKKTPDMLSIELTPKDTPTNSSKSQIIVDENPLHISASIKNNTILINGGDKIGSDQSSGQFLKSDLSQPVNIKLEEQSHQDLYQQEEYLKRPDREKPLFSNVPYDRQKKSILGSSMNDLFNGEESLKENSSLHPSKITIDKPKNDLTKIVIIQTKEKELCRTEAACKPSTLCSLNICGPDAPCSRTTLNLQHFKEIHEAYRETRDVNHTHIKVNENARFLKECTAETTGLCGKVLYTTQCNKMKRQAQKMNVSKLFNILKPVFILSTKGDDEGSEDNIGVNSGFVDKVNLKEPSDVTYEKGNKKVENKILEGFINSIIANYSRDESKPVSKETTERNEEGAEALFRLLENSIPKRIDRDDLEDKKSDLWNLTPILVPESSISKYGDSPEYTKLGPFDENVIKSFLKKDSIPFLQEDKL